MSNSKKHTHLKKKAVSAAFWSGAENFMRQGLQFIVAVILARILSPEEFGTVALLYLFTGIALVFIDSGFSSALIQRQDTTLTDESTVFWFNLAMGILVAILLWFSAPLIANFFNLSILIPLTKVIAFSLVVNALGSVQMTMFIKQLNFKILMKTGILSTFISGAVAISLAIYGYGIWALAFQMIVGSVVTTSLLWLYSSWRPKLNFSYLSLRSLFSFGGYLMLSALLDVVYNRAYYLLIGKFYGVRDLGFYTRADNTKQIPVDLLSRTLERVAFPIFSAAAHDKEKLQRGTKLAVRGIMLVNVPMMLGLMVTAENVVHVIFGEKWLPAVPILQVLCLAGIFWPLHVINLNILKAQGHSHLFFRLEIAKKIIGFSFLAIGMIFGIMGLAWSQVAFGIVGFMINAYYTGKFLDYGAFRQTADFIPGLLVAVIMAIVVFTIEKISTEEVVITLCLQVITGVCIYLGLSVFLKLKAYRDCINLLSKKLK